MPNGFPRSSRRSGNVVLPLTQHIEAIQVRGTAELLNHLSSKELPTTASSIGQKRRYAAILG
jgi:hypothetical protein